MSFNISVLPQYRLGVAIGSDSILGHDIVRICGDLVDSDGWRPGFDEVWDLTAADVVDISPDDIALLVRSVRRNREVLGQGHVVCVTNRDSLVVLVRLIETLTLGTGRTFTPVRSRAEAAEHLGLHPTALDGVPTAPVEIAAERIPASTPRESAPHGVMASRSTASRRRSR